MLGFSVFAADSDAEGELLASSMQQAFVALRTGRPGKIAPPVAGYLDSLPPQARAMLKESMSCAAIGSPQKVQRELGDFIARTGADELMITCQVFDHAARRRSYEIAWQARQALSA